MNTQLFYIHGYRSHPDQMNPKTEFLQEFCNKHNYELIKPYMAWETRGTEVLDQLIDSLNFLDRFESRRKIFVGTSLGGAGALNLFSQFNHEDNRCILINPLLDYSVSSLCRTEVKMIFDQSSRTEEYREDRNFYTNEASSLTLDKLRSVDRMIMDNLEFIDSEEYYLHNFQFLLGQKDQIIPPEGSIELLDFYNMTYEISLTGSHSFSDPQSMEILKEALQRAIT